MAVTAPDLTYPAGEIRAEWFAGEDLAVNLATWIDQGYESATAVAVVDLEDRDTIARAYGYWRAYDAKAHQLAATPNSVDIPGEIGVSGFTGQAKFFRDKANAWKIVFTDALAEAVAEEAGVPTQPVYQSVATPNTFRW